MKFGSVVHDGVGIALMWHSISLTHIPVDALVIPETDPGGPLASPRWRFCGFGGRLGSNEKVEMTLSASGQTGRGLLRAHLHFLPWLCLTQGSLEAFVGRPSNPGRSLLMFE